jgi:hypothetical protein
MGFFLSFDFARFPALPSFCLFTFSTVFSFTVYLSMLLIFEFTKLESGEEVLGEQDKAAYTEVAKFTPLQLAACLSSSPQLILSGFKQKPHGLRTKIPSQACRLKVF